MVIKVIKATRPYYWWSKKIGYVFHTCVRCIGKPTGDEFHVFMDGVYYFILEDDCEIIESGNITNVYSTGQIIRSYA